MITGELRDLKEKVYNAVEPGNTLIIGFYKGTQCETDHDGSYDDDNWYVYEIDTYSKLDKEVRLFQCYGDFEEQVLTMYLKKKEENG